MIAAWLVGEEYMMISSACCLGLVVLGWIVLTEAAA